MVLHQLLLFVVGGLFWTCLAQHNLSPFGNVSQSSTYKNNTVRYGPQKAIDVPKSNDWSNGDTIYCTHTTGGEDYNWWRIEFPSSVYISTVQIYYRTEWARRMDGFRLSVTNDPDNVTDSDVCFKDRKDGTAQIAQTVDCNRIGKVLLFDKYKKDNSGAVTFIELCYLGINGCFFGYWGSNCTVPCPIDCVGGNCFPENGTCVWGSTYDNLAINSIPLLKPHNSNHPANLAIDGNRTDLSCSKTNGSDAWLQIDLLRMSVVSTIYINFGDLPVSVYSIYVSNTSKNVTSTGNSLVSLYHGKQSLVELTKPVITRYLIYVPDSQNGQKSINICEFEVRGCVAGIYGIACNNTCPVNCIGACDLKTGRCISGCKNGWLGDLCDEACSEGFFGHKCQQKCSLNCLYTPCNHVTGECDSCKKGWTSYNCTEECGTGRFGMNCTEKCEGCVSNECDRFDGACRNTTFCNPGYKVDTNCSHACDDWTFGLNCSGVCHCRNKPCDKRHGICEDGCDKGWRTDSCNIGCFLDGSYGYSCEQSCTTCINMSCEAVDGNCSVGCKPGFSGPSCHIKVLAMDPTSDVNVGLMVGITAVILVIITVIVAIIIVRRRSHTRRKPYAREESGRGIDERKFNHSKTTSDQYINVSVKPDKLSASFSKQKHGFTNMSLELEKDDDDNKSIDVNIYGNVQKTQSSAQYKIPIENLETVIEEKGQNNGFQEEFELLPKGLMHPHLEGAKEINKIKNRFKTTWPYDHSRVILNDDSKHDYINANFINSYTKEKAYIATQGPKRNTIRDFWHMIWQESVEVIVMVTTLEESGRTMCDHYWTSEVNIPMSLDIYTIVMTSEKHHSVYDYRCIAITSKKTNKQKVVHHFHFTQWPDHGVPDTIKLVEFYRKVKRQCRVQDGPLLVHCRAGIGRTGTFIAIDALHSLGMATGKIDVMEYVQIMRKDRMNMIQTHEQYKTVFVALLELFTVPDTSIPTSDFCRFFEEQDQASLPSNQNLYRKQFQRLQSMRPSYPKDVYSASCHPNNSTKNSDTSILAHDRYRPYLRSYVRNSNDYINAVIIPGFLLDNDFLVTQSPLQSTIVDFWTMISDHDCELIVLMDNPNINAQIVPDEDNPFSFEKLSVHKENDISETDECVILEDETNKIKRKVYIVTYNEWNKDTLIPTSTHLFIDFHKKMKDYGQKCAGKVTVVCRDGCSKCGVYVALSLVLGKMELDNEIDIFHVVRTIQVRRPEFLSGYEQYEFCYKFVRDCLIEEESLYANT